MGLVSAIADLLDQAVVHENVRDRVDPRVTLGAWCGLGLVLLQGVVIRLGHEATSGFPAWPIVRWAFTGMGHPQLWLLATAVVLAVGAGLAVASHGFRRAASVGQAGQLALLGTGAIGALPMAWIVLVGAAVIAFFVAMGVAIVFVIGAALADA